MNAVNAAAIVTTFLVLYAFGLLAVQPVTLSVNRLQGFEPLTVEAQIRIPRNAENREACVTLGGPKEYPLACWDLDINSAPVFSRTWRDLPAGGYRAQAAIRRTGGWVHSNVVLLRVAGEEL